MKKLSTALSLISASLLFGLTASAQYTPTLTYDDDVTRGVYFGSGNSNGNFTTNRNDDLGLELGLRGKMRFQNTYNSLGNGQYVFPTGEFPPVGSGLALWNFEFSVDTDFNDELLNGETLFSYYFELTIDKDPTSGVDPLNITLAAIPGADTNFPNGFFQLPAGAQDSENFAFFEYDWGIFGSYDFDPNAVGSYMVSLSAYGWHTDELLASTEIEILVSDGQITPVPEPSTIAFFSLGGLGMILFIRRRQLRKA